MNTNDEIISLEKKYWQAMGDADIETAVSLTRFPCIVSGPQGTRRISEDEYRSMMKSHPSDQYKTIEMKNPHVESLGDKAAIISYETNVNGMKMSDLSTWIRQGDQWVCAFHSENPLH